MEAAIAFGSTYGGALSTVFSVFSAISQGNQASEAANYNAQVAQNNAIASQQQASANAAAQQRQARLKIGAMRAGYGASGLALEGSPMDVIENSASIAELDRQNILYGGKIKSQGYEATAGLELMRGQNARSNSYMSAGKALFGGAVSGSFDSFKLTQSGNAQSEEDLLFNSDL